METIRKITHWGNRHHPAWLVVFRIALGIIIFYKGLLFAQNPHGLRSIVEGHNFDFLSFFLIQYLPIVHLTGGAFIAFGLVTRAAILFQLPILIGALIFTGKATGFFDLYSEFGLALIVFLLLVLFLIFGSGPISLDRLFNRLPLIRE